MDKRETFMRQRHAGWRLVNEMQNFEHKMGNLTRAIEQFRRVCETNEVKKALKRGWIDGLALGNH